MNRLEREALFTDLEMNIEKADFMAEKLIAHYELGEGAPENQMDALCFARERPSICMELEIIRDYIKIISDMAHKIEKEMNV